MRNINPKNSSAFTMIELVFAIIVIGILASLVLPRIERDLTQEAVDSILSDIRYTQHLALMDNMHKFNKPKWQKAFWRIGFENCANSTGIYEYIGSDKDYQGAIADNEAAVDPANGKKMIWSGTKECIDGGDNNTSGRIFITKKYGIKTVTWGDACNKSQYIGFDYLGRTHRGFAGDAITTPNYSTYLTSTCTITFTMSDDKNISISIAPETGYAQIIDQNGS